MSSHTIFPKRKERQNEKQTADREKDGKAEEEGDEEANGGGYCKLVRHGTGHLKTTCERKRDRAQGRM